MIVQMKKVFLVIQEKDAADALGRIRKLGVLHVEHLNPPKGDKLASLGSDLALINQAISLLEGEDNNRRLRQENKEFTQWHILARHIVDLSKRLAQLKDFSINVSSKIEILRAWGDFDPQDIAGLGAKGICVRFYKLSDEQLRAIPAGVYLKKVSRQGGINNCVIVSQGQVDLPFKESELPKDSLSRLKKRLAEDNKVLKLIQEELENQAVYLDFLRAAREKITLEVEFLEAFFGMAKDGALSYIKGYIPFDRKGDIEEAALKEGWGVLTTDPAEDDIVPTLVRNPRWINVINPVFRVIEILPGYRELDISLWFLIFFSVFFGILIGDAGYGSVYLLLTLLAKKKWGRKIKDKSVFALFYLLSACAIIWGLLTATFFGQEWLLLRLKPLIPALLDGKNMQSFCFFLGALHLTIAHSWRMALKLPSLIFLADLGWIIILWLAFFVARMLILGNALPDLSIYLVILGPALVVFFSNPQKNILKCLGSGLGALLLNIMNNFTDVVSYVRLFAVGLATVAVADSFNNMAQGIGFNNLASGLLTSFVLLVGHLLNIMLGPLSVLVHGVRLNVLEFCSHLDIKWSGFIYKPLTEK